jgi:hypothetical protein
LVGVGVGVGVGAEDVVAAGVDVADFVAVADLLGFGAVVALFDAAGVELATGAEVAGEDEFPTGRFVEPPRDVAESADVKVGGVIVSTAPRPLSVPPAINNARFIFLLSPFTLRKTCIHYW